MLRFGSLMMNACARTPEASRRKHHHQGFARCLVRRWWWRSRGGRGATLHGPRAPVPRVHGMLRGSDLRVDSCVCVSAALRWGLCICPRVRQRCRLSDTRGNPSNEATTLDFSLRTTMGPRARQSEPPSSQRRPVHSDFSVVVPNRTSCCHAHEGNVTLPLGAVPPPRRRYSSVLGLGQHRPNHTQYY